MRGYQEIEELVEKWAKDKSILAKSDPKTQCLKFASEAGELCDAVAKGDRAETIDAIGDTVVTLIILCKLEGLYLEDCLEKAYEVIAKRKGEMVNGTFVKEGGQA